jgi:hypothetical protein
MNEESKILWRKLSHFEVTFILWFLGVQFCRPSGFDPNTKFSVKSVHSNKCWTVDIFFIFIFNTTLTWSSEGTTEETKQGLDE